LILISKNANLETYELHPQTQNSWLSWSDWYVTTYYQSTGPKREQFRI